MPFFNPMRDYYHRQQAKRLGQLGADLQVVIELTESCCGTSIFPGSNTLARIEHEGQPIGEVHYGVNPLADRLYINMIQIHPTYRFRGLAIATLWRLWQQHQVPIVPLSQLDDSTFFWVHARRRLAAAGALIEAPLSLRELERTKECWSHPVHHATPGRSNQGYWEWVASEHPAVHTVEPGAT